VLLTILDSGSWNVWANECLNVAF